MLNGSLQHFGEASALVRKHSSCWLAGREPDLVNSYAIDVAHLITRYGRNTHTGLDYEGQPRLSIAVDCTRVLYSDVS